MEATHNTLQIIQNYVKTPSVSVDAPKVIKPEDVHKSSLLDIPAADSTPKSRTNKKRKSWGQVLPEPKTNLPPRKRAKTDDEKEQRRIERVKRNRLVRH
jgi:transcriptional activator HAC1